MIIYLIENRINGKQYVGQTTQSLSDRFKAHYHEWSNNYLKNSMRKYGLENFSIREIDRADSIKELNEKEIYWIKKLNTITKGYNLTEGGRNSKHSIQIRQKMSSSRKKYYKDHPEFRDKQSQASLGLSNNMYGKTHTLESKQKISSALQGRTAWNKGKESPYKGVPRSEEVRAKISLAHRLRVESKGGGHHRSC